MLHTGIRGFNDLVTYINFLLYQQLYLDKIRVNLLSILLFCPKLILTLVSCYEKQVAETDFSDVFLKDKRITRAATGIFDHLSFETEFTGKKMYNIIYSIYYDNF